MFVFDRKNDNYIANDVDYPQVINELHRRYKQPVPDANVFLNRYYWAIKPSHKNVICNDNTYIKLTKDERKNIVFTQSLVGVIHIMNNTTSIFAACKNVRGRGNILRNRTF